MEPPRGLELRRVDAANEQEVREYAEVCALFGLSLLPEFRRRGIQQALIAARLNSASVRGARLATMAQSPARRRSGTCGGWGSRRRTPSR